MSWWEGPDEDGHAWLMIDMRAAVSAARTHGADLVARVLVSNVRTLPHQYSSDRHGVDDGTCLLLTRAKTALLTRCALPPPGALATVTCSVVMSLAGTHIDAFSSIHTIQHIMTP